MTTEPEDDLIDKGMLWLATLPNGKTILLHRGDALKKWHREIGTFPDEATAKAYARRRGFKLEEPSKRLVDRQVEPAPARLGKQILEKLPALYAKHPLGISVDVLLKAIEGDHDYHSMLAAVRWLDYTKRAQWVYRGSGSRKFLFPKDVAAPSRSSLSAAQEKVLAVLLADAKDSDGLTSIGYRDIARGAGIQRGTVAHIIDTLRTRGYVELIKSGASKTTDHGYNKPSIYRVTSTPTKKQAAEQRLTLDDLSPEALQGRSDAEIDGIERKFWEQAGINPDTDLYPPEEAKARVETTLRACLGIPPASEEERALREQIGADMDKHKRTYKRRKS